MDTQVKEEVGFRLIKDVKPDRDTYSNVEIYMALQQKKGRELKISEAAVELIKKGLKADGIE